MVTTSDLRRRWSEPGRLGLVRETRTWLMGNGPRPGGLEEIDGRLDLRGIPLFATPAIIGDASGGVHWESLDLSAAELDQLRISNSQISNCCFDRASMTSFKLWGTNVSDCTFRRTDLRSSALGTGSWEGRRDSWLRVAFDRANLRQASFTAAVLDNCSFEKTSKLLQLVDCEVIECTFRGELDSLLIDGRGHRYPVDPSAFSADFRAATLRNSSITGYRLDEVSLPDQPDLAVIRHYPTALRSAVAWLGRSGATESEVRLGRIYERALISHGAEDSDYCYDIGGYDNPSLTEAATRALTHVQGSIRA